MVEKRKNGVKNVVIQIIEKFRTSKQRSTPWDMPPHPRTFFCSLRIWFSYTVQFSPRLNHFSFILKTLITVTIIFISFSVFILQQFIENKIHFEIDLPNWHILKLNSSFTLSFTLKIDKIILNLNISQISRQNKPTPHF